MGINPYIQDLKDGMGLNFTPMMPAAGVCIENENGEILLQQRSDNGQWNLPGGSCDAGDTFLTTAVREIAEETGLILEPQNLTLFALLSAPELEKITYPDGSQTHYYSAWFHTTQYSGDLTLDDDETLALKFYALDNLPDDKYIMPSTRFLLYTAFQEYKKNKTVTVR